MLIEAEGLRGLLLSTGLDLVPVETERQRGKKPEERLAEALSTYIDGLLPDGPAAFTLSALQARTVITLLAPGWAMHTVKFMAMDYVHKLQAPLLVELRSKKETENALKQIEYVLFALTALQPAPDVNVFMATVDGRPQYDPDAANNYMRSLAAAWENMPLRDDAPANLS